MLHFDCNGGHFCIRKCILAPDKNSAIPGPSPFPLLPPPEGSEHHVRLPGQPL